MEEHTRPFIWAPRPSVSQRIYVYLPYAVGNRGWLKENSKGCRVRNEKDIYHRQVWSCSRKVLWLLLDAIVEDLGHCALIQDYARTQRCDTRCRAALGPDCECSCAGVWHGADKGATALSGREFSVGDTTIINIEEFRLERHFVRGDK